MKNYEIDFCLGCGYFSDKNEPEGERSKGDYYRCPKCKRWLWQFYYNSNEQFTECGLTDNDESDIHFGNLTDFIAVLKTALEFAKEEEK